MLGGICYKSSYFISYYLFNNNIEKDGLDVLVVSFGRSCSNTLVSHLPKNGFRLVKTIVIYGKKYYVIVLLI